MEERSLDEFLEGDDETDNSSPAAETASEADVETEDTETASGPKAGESEIEPAAATSRVVPAGQNCDRCEESVTRLWTTDGEELCRSCVKW